MAERLSDPARRAVVDGLIVAGLLFAAYLFLVVAPAAGTFDFDAYASWAAILVATAIWLGGRPVRPILAVFASPQVALEVYHGNVHLLMAAAIA
jgi:hypothetical protein